MLFQLPVPDVGQPGQGGVRQKKDHVAHGQQGGIEIPGIPQKLLRQAHDPQKQSVEKEGGGVAHRQPGQEAQEPGGQGGDFRPEDGLPAEEQVDHGGLPIRGEEQP